VWRQGKRTGEVTGLEDCMGCARCIISCPTDALAIHDVRNLFRPSLRQDASHLLKRNPAVSVPRVEPEQRPSAMRLTDWNETEQSLSLEDLKLQAERCLDCGVPGCRNACPLGNFIPDWLEAAAKGNWKHAGELAHSTSPLPEVCGTICPQHRLCEGACTRSRMEGAVTIGAVERSIATRALTEGWRPSVAARRSGHRAAIIGAGPAGLSCAERLNRSGVDVTIYDRSPKIGGLLRTGVPSFKLDKSLLDRRQAVLEQSGIQFVLNTFVDEASISDLLETNDAIFLGLGAQKPKTIELPGQTLPGVEPGLGWLHKINTGSCESLHGRRVLVLGGGDTAMDCARSALRLEAEVTIAYRGPADSLRASPKEIKLTREEGGRFELEHVPVRCEGSRQLTGVRFDTPSGKRVIDADLTILALGQQPAPPHWLTLFDIATDPHGNLCVDARGRTTHRKIWAGGDNTLGPNLAVNAMAAGRMAANGILAGFSTAGDSLWRG
ncbi:MAG: FAD-dependent oxidoreductase, partial [Gammaproteobacteria bacterium]|nr:FAD-dependent oxidoreductase [Gammaproteobacteria bacterium]